MKYRTILLFGAPGAGKGTQGKILGTIPNFFHCACGDVFRSLKTNSEIGKIFLAYEEGAFGKASFDASKALFGTQFTFDGGPFKSALMGGSDYSGVLEAAKECALPTCFIRVGGMFCEIYAAEGAFAEDGEDVVVYDNVSAAPDDLTSANPQVIGGGSIVIHKPK